MPALDPAELAAQIADQLAARQERNEIGRSLAYEEVIEADRATAPACREAKKRIHADLVAGYEQNEALRTREGPWSGTVIINRGFRALPAPAPRRRKR